MKQPIKHCPETANKTLHQYASMCVLQGLYVYQTCVWVYTRTMYYFYRTLIVNTQ